MSVESFLDTNLFIYQLEDLDERKAGIADGIIRQGIEDQSASISFQVVQECLNTALRKAEIPLDREQMLTYVERVLDPLWTVMPSVALYRRALEVQGRYRYGFYDSLIIASALEAGCRKLYSEDLQDGQEIGHLRIENPFAEANS